MQTRDWIELILSVLGGIGFLFLGLGYAYSQLKEGSNKNKLDTIGLLKEDVAALKKVVQDNHDEIIRLQEQLKSAMADKKRLEEIVENRNPDLESILKEVRDFMKAITASNLHQTSILDKQVKDEADIAHRDRNLEVGRTN